MSISQSATSGAPVPPSRTAPVVFTIDSNHLTPEERFYECQLRGITIENVPIDELHEQLNAAFKQEQQDRVDTIALYRLTTTSEELSTSFPAFSELHRTVGEFVTTVNADMTKGPIPNEAIRSRCRHYDLRVRRQPIQFDSIACGLLDRLQSLKNKIDLPAMSASRAPAEPIQTERGPEPTKMLNSTTHNVSHESSLDTVTTQFDTAPQITEHSSGPNRPQIFNQSIDSVITHLNGPTTDEILAWSTQETPGWPRGLNGDLRQQLTAARSFPSQGAASSTHHGPPPHMNQTVYTEFPHSGSRTFQVIQPNTSAPSIELLPVEVRPFPGASYPQISSSQTQPPIIPNQSNPPTNWPQYQGVNGAPINWPPFQGTGPHSTITSSSSMQMQVGTLQMIRRFFNNKSFDGTVTEKDHLPLEEFLALVHMFIRSNQGGGELLIRNVAALLTGPAFVWWTTRQVDILTWMDFVPAIRQRFASETGTLHGIISTIYNRFQTKSETLPDFVDIMMSMMNRIPDVFSFQDKIRIIVNNMTPEYRPFFQGKRFPTANDFAAFTAEIAVAVRPRTALDKDDKKPRPFPRSARVDTAEIEAESDEEPAEEDEADPGDLLEVMTAALQLYSQQRKSGKFNPKKPAQKSTPTRRLDHKALESDGRMAPKCQTCQEPNQVADKASSNPVKCYGCGKPNTYLRNCQDCQSQIQRLAPQSSKNVNALSTPTSPESTSQ